MQLHHLQLPAVVVHALLAMRNKHKKDVHQPVSFLIGTTKSGILELYAKAIGTNAKPKPEQLRTNNDSTAHLQDTVVLHINPQDC